MRNTILLLGLLFSCCLLTGCTSAPSPTRSRHRAGPRYAPPPGLVASHSIGSIDLWVNPDWMPSALTWRLFMPPVSTRHIAGQGSNDTGLDVQWGCQAFESALRHELHENAFEIITRSRRNSFYLEVILEAQSASPGLQTPVCIQAELTVPDHKGPVLILRTPARGSPIRQNGIMRAWGEAQDEVRVWAQQVASALDHVRRTRVR
ncbi:MAG: hypothetical protein OSB42_12850 [Planctomycetota bacterium]|nr:hypothetical protein [Planctomycetota bacterium]